MHLFRSTSAFIMVLMLMTTECFCMTAVNAQSFGLRTKTSHLHKPASDRTDYHQDDDHHGVHLETKTIAPASLSAVCCMTWPRLFAKSRRCKANLASTNKTVFDDKVPRNSTSLRQNTANYGQIMPLVRIPANPRPHTKLSTQIPMSMLRRQHSNIDYDRELQSRQTLWSARQNAAATRLKVRRRLPQSTKELAAEDSSIQNEQMTDSSSQLSGWHGDPEVFAQPLVSKVNRDSITHKYFVGKRLRTYNKLV